MELDEEGHGRCAFEPASISGSNANAQVAMGGPAAEYILRNPVATEFSITDCNASKEDLQEIETAYSGFPECSKSRFMGKTGVQPVRRCGQSGRAFNASQKCCFSTSMPAFTETTFTH
jgi:hypothetical protein